MPLFTTKRRPRARRRNAAPARKRRTATKRINPTRSRRRARKARRNYWPNNTAGHRSAAKKGWKRRRVRFAFAKDYAGKKHRRKNPGRTYRRKLARRNPYRARRYTRRTRRNPLSIRSFTNKSMLMTIASFGVGFVGGFFTLPLVAKILPASVLADRAANKGVGKVLGLINVAIGIALFSVLKNKRLQEVSMGIAGSGIYDLLAMNVPQLGLTALPTTSGLIDSVIPSQSGTYPTMISPNSGIAGSYGAGGYERQFGSSYESPALRAFGDDLDGFGE